MGDPADGWQSGVARLARLFSSTVVIGAVTGAVLGGLGGRLAMRILFLTSGDKVKGIESDDGFTIGQFTLADTIGLVILCTVLGVFAAMLFLLAQPFVERFGAFAVPAMALFYGVVAGAAIVNPDGVDFTVLEPVALAIVLFVAIFAGFGAIVSALVNRAAARSADSNRPWWLVAPPLVVLLFPPLMIVTVVVLLVHLADRTMPIWRVLHAGALTAMAAIFTLSAVNLASDAAELL